MNYYIIYNLYRYKIIKSTTILKFNLKIMSLYKKVFIIFLNIIIIAVLFIIADFMCYANSRNIFYDYMVSLRLKSFDEFVQNYKYRDCIIPNSKKRPILIFGCSFAYGWNLEKEQSISYKLAKTTKRSVYNRAISGAGLQYMLYMLQHNNIEKEVKDPEYILYIFIENHIYRLSRPYFGPTEPVIEVLYKNENGKLKEYRNKFYQLGRSTIFRTLSSNYNHYLYRHTTADKSFDAIKTYFLESNSIIKKKFPNSKLVILLYETYEPPRDYSIYYNKKWKELKDAGIIVLDTYSMTGKHLNQFEYCISKDVHPNEKAVDMVVQSLVKNLNL